MGSPTQLNINDMQLDIIFPMMKRGMTGTQIVRHLLDLGYKPEVVALAMYETDFAAAYVPDKTDGIIFVSDEQVHTDMTSIEAVAMHTGKPSRHFRFRNDDINALAKRVHTMKKNGTTGPSIVEACIGLTKNGLIAAGALFDAGFAAASRWVDRSLTLIVFVSDAPVTADMERITLTAVTWNHK